MFQCYRCPYLIGCPNSAGSVCQVNLVPKRAWCVSLMYSVADLDTGVSSQQLQLVSSSRRQNTENTKNTRLVFGNNEKWSVSGENVTDRRNQPSRPSPHFTTSPRKCGQAGKLIIGPSQSHRGNIIISKTRVVNEKVVISVSLWLPSYS